MSGAFTARYHGRCTSCHERISPGDPVTYNDDDELVHQDCDQHAPRTSKPAPVCTTCWLTKPCGCDDERSGVIA